VCLLAANSETGPLALERRVILPLAQPQLAERLGLVPPRAIVLGFPPSGGTPAPVTAVLVAEGEDE
jgi:transitional endoplasmic reticulum ATPase